MPGRKSNGTETHTDPRTIFGRAEFSVRHPLPGSPGGGFFADRGLRRVDRGGGNFPKGSTDEKRESQPVL